MKEGLPQLDKHKVVVLSITYNQSQYIEETLRGFSIQQTDFPFLCCVFDDASTDGEQDILRRWINDHCNHDDVEVYDHPLAIILKAPDKNNPNCIYVIHLQKFNTWGKPEKKELLNYWQRVGEYIAMCEGDDCWIDSLKLQKQIDFMDANPDYSLCFHNAIVLNERVESKERIKSFCYFKSDQQIPTERLIEDWHIPTASALYRMSSFEQLQLPKFFSGDYILELALATVGKVYYIDRYMSVYRLNNGGVSSMISVKKWKNQLFGLLEWYDNHTSHQYHDEIQLRIREVKKNTRYITLKDKNMLLPIICMPKYTLKMLRCKLGL